MADKKSFILYYDMRAPLELLTDEQRGKLFLHIFDYAEKGELPKTPDAAVNMAFAFIRAALDRDAVTWGARKEERAESGRRGGLRTQEKIREAKANQAELQTAKAGQANQAVPTPVPVPAPVPVPVPVPAPGKQKNADKPLRKFVPPTLEEVKEYCRDRGSSVDAQTFCDYYAAAGWKDGSGKAVRNWKQKLIAWEGRAEKSITKTRNISDPASYSSEEVGW